MVTSWSAIVKPSTTPKMTSPSTMIVNSPKRSTSDSVGITAGLSPTADRPASMIPTTHATEFAAHTNSRASGGRNALIRNTTTETAVPTLYRPVTTMYSGLSCRRTAFQCQVMNARKTA